MFPVKMSSSAPSNVIVCGGGLLLLVFNSNFVFVLIVICSLVTDDAKRRVVVPRDDYSRPWWMFLLGHPTSNRPTPALWLRVMCWLAGGQHDRRPMSIDTGRARWPFDVVAAFTLVHDLLAMWHPSHVRPIVVHAHVAHQHYAAALDVARERTIDWCDGFGKVIYRLQSVCLQMILLSLHLGDVMFHWPK